MNSYLWFMVYIYILSIVILGNWVYYWLCEYLFVGWWWLEHYFYFPIQLGIIISIDFHIFQRGSNHQPVWVLMGLRSPNTDIHIYIYSYICSLINPLIHELIDWFVMLYWFIYTYVVYKFTCTYVYIYIYIHICICMYMYVWI